MSIPQLPLRLEPPGVLPGRHALEAFEDADEVGHISEPRIQRRVGDRAAARGEQHAGLLDAVIAQVFDGRAVRRLFEEAAEVLGRHAGLRRQTAERKRLAVSGLDQLQHALELADAPRLRVVRRIDRAVGPLRAGEADKLQQAA